MRKPRVAKPPLPRLWAAATLLALALSPVDSRAEEYNLPDPPNALVFDVVPARVVPVPNEKVPDTCESKYRAGMEGAFQQIWSQCQGVGKQEPSDCQRNLFDRCTKLAADLQKMESGACLKMDGESEAVKTFKGVDNQRTSQVSTADLNRRAYVATKQVINTLQQSARELDVQRKNALTTLNAATCAASTSARAYNSVAAKVVTQLDAAKAHVAATIGAKETAAAQFAKNSGVSVQNLDKLVSLPPGSSTITSATSKPEVLVANTASTATATRESAATVIVTTSTSTPVTVATLTAVNTATQSPVLPPYVAPPERKNINWVPILAAGIPAAAILGVLALSKNSRNGFPSDSGTPGGGVDSGGANPGDGNHNPNPTFVPGGGDLVQWNVKIDASFTDRQRAGIAEGFAKIPPCYRYKLQGIFVRNRALGRYSAKKCIAGQFFFGGNVVDLSPSCTDGAVPIGVAVHEFFHVLGNRNGNQLHNAFWPVMRQYPNCPVSSYGNTNKFEDFAETGRLLEYPESGGAMEAKNSGACVDATIAALGRIMSFCPGQPK